MVQWSMPYLMVRVTIAVVNKLTWQQGKTYGLKEKKGRISREVKAVFEEHLQRYGSRRIEVELKENGTQAGRYQIRKRMKEQGLKAIQPKSLVPKTTHNLVHR